mgnify:CR=1 FL=1
MHDIIKESKKIESESRFVSFSIHCKIAALPSFELLIAPTGIWPLPEEVK